jgi:hypothetical protein
MVTGYKLAKFLEGDGGTITDAGSVFSQEDRIKRSGTSSIAGTVPQLL